MKKSWTLVDAYDSYKGNLSRDKYLTILKEFFWELSNIIIRKKYSYRMGNIGRIFIARHTIPEKNSKKKVDWKYYNETGKIKYLLNLHTDGYYYFFKWNISRYLKDAKLYEFKPNRGNDYIIGARGLCKFIKDSANDPTMKDYTSL